MSVLVVGSQGYIGRALCLALAERGVDVVPVSSRDGHGINPDTGCLSAGFEIPEGVESVVFLSQSPRHQPLPDAVDHLLNVNIVSAVAVAALAVQAGVKRFVYASSGSIYARSFCPLSERAPLRRDDWYALSKVHAEESLALFGTSIQVCALRLFGVYGPGQSLRLVPRLIERIRSNEPITIERSPTDRKDMDGLRISLCYIDDTVRVIERAALSGAPPSLNVAGEKPHSIREICTVIGKQLGRRPRFRVVDSYRAGDWAADVSLLKRQFDLVSTPLEEGIARTLRHEVQETLNR